jgi:asparagine synthase (glutamine-hydrolysing)
MGGVPGEHLANISRNGETHSGMRMQRSGSHRKRKKYMCGIAGIIGNITSHQNHKNMLQLMLSKIEHRGDKENTYECKALPLAALGCNRLAIVDRVDGHQPLTNNDNTIIAVLNGEIYNHCEIRQQLHALGYIFQTDTDTEILVHGYQEWGEEVLNRLDGIFAFIIYDSKKNHFLAARDHIGIKPLYYLYDKEVYYIASEMKALLFLNKDIQTLKLGYFLTKNGEKNISVSWYNSLRRLTKSKLFPHSRSYYLVLFIRWCKPICR